MELHIEFITKFIKKNNKNIIHFFENCFTNAILKKILWCHDNYYKVKSINEPMCSHDPICSHKLMCSHEHICSHDPICSHEHICSHDPICSHEHIDLFIKNQSTHKLMPNNYKSVKCNECGEPISNICYAHNNTNIDKNLIMVNKEKEKCICNGFWTWNVSNFAYLCEICSGYQLYDSMPLKKCNNCNNIKYISNINSNVNDKCDDCANSEFDVLYDEIICINKKTKKCYYCESTNIINYGIVLNSYNLCYKCYNNEVPNMTYVKPIIYDEYYLDDTSIIQISQNCSKYYQFIYEYVDNNNVVKEITLHYLNSCCGSFDKLLSSDVTVDNVLNIINICVNKSNELNYDILKKTCYKK